MTAAINVTTTHHPLCPASCKRRVSAAYWGMIKNNAGSIDRHDNAITVGNDGGTSLAAIESNPIPIPKRNEHRNDHTKPMIATKSTNHQNSLRRARPLKSKYFFKQVFTAVQNGIMGLACGY